MVDPWRDDLTLGETSAGRLGLSDLLGVRVCKHRTWPAGLVHLHSTGPRWG